MSIDLKSSAVSSVDGKRGSVDGRYSQAIFFGKGGNDSNDGKSYIQRKLTLASAKTAAAGLTPATDNVIAIVCEDGGTYSESYTNDEFVNLIAPSAKITGNITVAEDCIIQLGELNGNLTVNASTTLRSTIYNITGSITKTGNIYGQAGTAFYFGTITGNS